MKKQLEVTKLFVTIALLFGVCTVTNAQDLFAQKSTLWDSEKRTITPPGCSESYIYVSLSSYLDYHTFPTFLAGAHHYGFEPLKGTTTCRWMGTNPYDADDISMTSEFYFSGLSASASGGSGGVGTTVTVDGDTITRTENKEDAWKLEYNHASIRVSGHVIYRSETVDCAPRLNGTRYSVSAHDSDWL